MPEYYDPMLFMSTPDHPNTMGVVVVLKEPVDGELLSSVVGELRERFPYYYVRARAVGNDLELIPNPLPMTVRKSWEPINFNSQASNYHLAAWKYEGTRIAFEIAHSLTDGAGVLPYIKSAMYLYLTRKTGERLDPHRISAAGGQNTAVRDRKPVCGSAGGDRSCGSAAVCKGTDDGFLPVK